MISLPAVASLVDLNRRARQVLADEKWKKFLLRARLFSFVPFVEFVLGAGSLATGKVRSESDFDVIVGVRIGRIFTARFLSATLFGLFGWRRQRLNHEESAANKICLNHFVTEKSWRLNAPYSDSWRELYQNLVPIFGDPRRIKNFFDANRDWSGESRFLEDDLRFRYRRSSWLKVFLEILLGGVMGDVCEAFFKFWQMKKINRALGGVSENNNPRLIFSDEELEFHPDRRKFENGADGEAQ